VQHFQSRTTSSGLEYRFRHDPLAATPPTAKRPALDVEIEYRKDERRGRGLWIDVHPVTLDRGMEGRMFSLHGYALSTDGVSWRLEALARRSDAKLTALAEALDAHVAALAATWYADAAAGLGALSTIVANLKPAAVVLTALRLDPSGTLTPYSLDASDSLRSLQRAVDGDIEHVAAVPGERPGEELSVYCNETGRLRGFDVATMLETEDAGVAFDLCGPVIISGVDRAGEARSLTPTEIAAIRVVTREGELQVLQLPGFANIPALGTPA
jgi:hypothetical protein